MSQRRMPSGQGPARGGAGPSPATGARPSGRGESRRAVERSAALDAAPRRSGRYAAAEPGPAIDHRAGPRPSRSGVRRAAGPARRTTAPRGSGPHLRPGGGARRPAARPDARVRVSRCGSTSPSRPRSTSWRQISGAARAHPGARRPDRPMGGRRVRDRAGPQPAAAGPGRASGCTWWASTRRRPGSPDRRHPTTWYQQLWSSVQTADNPPAP